MTKNNFQLKVNSEATDKTEIHYYDLPLGIKVKVQNLPKNLRLRGHTKTITIGRLIRNFGKNNEIDNCIQYLLNTRNTKYIIKLNLPINLVNLDYVRLYSLMLSEGSKKTEFRLHVPEKELHAIFSKSLENLLGIKHLVKNKSFRNISRSAAPRLLRFILPIPKNIPSFIISNKEFSKEYLRIAFECEGYVRFKKINNCIQRFIKISRNCNVGNLVVDRLKYPVGKRIFLSEFKKDYPDLFEIILANPDPIIIAEQLMLKQHFGIDSILTLESIRINKTSFRAGAISAKWVLKIYSYHINTFVKEIGFISKRKNSISKKMIDVELHRPKFFVLSLMKQISKNGIFIRDDYYNEMKKYNYKEVKIYLSRYQKLGLITKLDRNTFKINKF